MSAKYSAGQRVLVWWRSEFCFGRVIEVIHGNCYRVRLTDGEVCYRLESDLDPA